MGRSISASGVVACANTVTLTQGSCRMNPNFGAAMPVSFRLAAIPITTRCKWLWNKRLGHVVEIQSAYTYAQNLDTTASNMDGNDCGSGGATGFDPLNPQNDKGPGCSDVRNNWRANLIYHTAQSPVG